MREEMISIRNPNSNDLQHLKTLLNTVLRKNITSDVFKDYPLVFSPSNFKNIFILEENNEIVASGALYPMTYNLDGYKINFSAIGSVATKESCQGKGFGSLIIENLLKKSKELNSTFTVLWTDKHDFYKKFGFVLCGKEYALNLCNTKIQTNNNEHLNIVEFKNSDNNFSEDMYKLYSHDNSNKVVRKQKEFLLLSKLPETHYILGFKGKNLVSYIIIGKGEDLTNHIHEFFGNMLHVIPLIEYAINIYKPQTLTIIDKEKDSPVFEELQKMGGIIENRHLALFKILDLKKLLKTFNINESKFANAAQKEQISNEDMFFGNHRISGKIIDILPMDFYLRGLDSV